MRDDYPEAEDTELNVSYGNGNGANRIVWGVAGALGLLFLGLSGWVLAALYALNGTVTGGFARMDARLGVYDRDFARLENRIRDIEKERAHDRREP